MKEIGQVNMDNELEKNTAENQEQVQAPVVEQETPVQPEKEVKKEPEVKQSAEGKTSHKRIMQGRVVSNKADKSITVLIERHVAHPLYKKYYKRAKKVMAHDEENASNIGDIVKVIESRPLSRRKRWRMIEIVERAK